MKNTRDWIGEYVGLSFALLPGLALIIPLIFVEPPKTESNGDEEKPATEATTAAGG